MSKVHPFDGAVKKPATKRHVPLIWENMLATVLARSPKGEIRYFDYDYDAARAFAEVEQCSDLRLARNKEYPGDYKEPRLRQWVLFGIRN